MNQTFGHRAVNNGLRLLQGISRGSFVFGLNGADDFFDGGTHGRAFGLIGHTAPFVLSDTFFRLSGVGQNGSPGSER